MTPAMICDGRSSVGARDIDASVRLAHSGPDRRTRPARVSKYSSPRGAMTPGGESIVDVSCAAEPLLDSCSRYRAFTTIREWNRCCCRTSNTRSRRGLLPSRLRSCGRQAFRSRRSCTSSHSSRIGPSSCHGSRTASCAASRSYRPVVAEPFWVMRRPVCGVWICFGANRPSSTRIGCSS